MITVEQDRLAQNLKWRHERAAQWVAYFQKRESRYPWLRLFVLLAGIFLTYLCFQLLVPLAGWAAAFLSLAAFVVVALLHSRLEDCIHRLSAYEHHLGEQLARMKLDWAGLPEPSNLHVPAEHPFSQDLGITGEKSLHQLLDTAVSLGGSQRLAGWLLQPAPDVTAAQKRQEAVKELLPLYGLRTRLQLDGQLARPNPGSRWDAGVILRWLQRRTSAASLKGYLIALSILSFTNLTLIILSLLGYLPPVWTITMAVYLAMQSLKFRQTSEVFDEAFTLGRQLGLLRGVFSGLETYPYLPASLLRSTAAPFTDAERRPSRYLRSVSWIISAASLRSNPFLGLILNLLVPWDMFFAYQLEMVKYRLVRLLPAWLDAWYEMEALGSLANFARLNPNTTFPTIHRNEREPVLDVKSISHPLIDYTTRVANDFTFQRLGDLVLISGSNMSGKSTFLRTVGINLVLAFAGGPVSAEKLTTIPLRVFTSMSINDSLSDGISFFYAEVRRLKALLDAFRTGQPFPLFFLIDEIFRGTNNRERELGSRAYTRSLIGGYGTGIISTHDLSLVTLAEDSSHILNYHFQEDIQDNRMVFDYRIRPGASPTTNALRIMELAGLPVPENT